MAKVNRAETDLDYQETGVALREPLNQDAVLINFSACYTRSLADLVWFVLSRRADARPAADVAHSTATEFSPSCSRCGSASARARVLGYTSNAHCTLR